MSCTRLLIITIQERSPFIHLGNFREGEIKTRDCKRRAWREGRYTRERNGSTKVLTQRHIHFSQPNNRNRYFRRCRPYLNKTSVKSRSEPQSERSVCIWNSPGGGENSPGGGEIRTAHLDPSSHEDPFHSHPSFSEGQGSSTYARVSCREWSTVNGRRKHRVPWQTDNISH